MDTKRMQVIIENLMGELQKEMGASNQVFADYLEKEIGITWEELQSLKEQRPEISMPDSTISVKEMQDYGYGWEGMLPLRKEAAEKLFHEDSIELFKLYDDGSEGALDEIEEMEAHAANGGLFGVEKEAWEKLCERKNLKEQDIEMNQGYLIRQEITYDNLDGEACAVVLGEKETSYGMQYVTWQRDSEGGYNHGHYFSDKDAAKLDLFRRGLEKSSVDLRGKYMEEDALSDIDAALSYEFSEKQVDKLLENGVFKERALHAYYNVDHSYENDALRETLEDLYHEMKRDGILVPEEMFDFVGEKPCTIVTEKGETIADVQLAANGVDQIFYQSENKRDVIPFVDVKEVLCEGKEVYSKGFDVELTAEIVDSIHDMIDQENEKESLEAKTARYYVNSVWNYEPDASGNITDFTEIGVATKEFELYDGDNCIGSHDGYYFNLYDSLESAIKNSGYIADKIKFVGLSEEDLEIATTIVHRLMNDQDYLKKFEREMDEASPFDEKGLDEIHDMIDQENERESLEANIYEIPEGMDEDEYLMEKVLEKAEELGWGVTQSDGYVMFSQNSPAGQDFNIELYENYDVSEEVSLWTDNSGHERNGAPYEIEDLVKDMKWCEQAILDLHDNLKEFADKLEGKLEKSSQKESLAAKIGKAEEERLQGAKTKSISKARTELKECFGEERA